MTSEHTCADYTVHLGKFRELLRLSQWPELRHALREHARDFFPDQCPEAAVLALQAGLPDLAVQLAEAAGQEAQDVTEQVRLAAWLRLGEAERVQRALAAAADYRDVLMLARAHALLRQFAPAAEYAAQARADAFDAGDAPALLAAIALLGELELRTSLQAGSRSGAMSALNILAEGLKIGEQIGAPADPHVLALVALSQRHVMGFDTPSHKSQATAKKALGRSLAYSPASVLALLTLSRTAQAHAEAEAGALAAGWWAWADGQEPQK